MCLAGLPIVFRAGAGLETLNPPVRVRNCAGRHAGFAVRDAKSLSEMQNFRISGRHP